MEQVDILEPPLFKKSGITKSVKQTQEDSDWVGTFNLWIFRSDPEPAIVYQQRKHDASWAPSKLDVAVGGYYSAGEEMYDGLREAEEELGKVYRHDEVTFVGKRLNVTPDERGNTRHFVVHVFFTIDNTPLATYTPQPSELEGVFICPIANLKQIFESNSTTFIATGIDLEGNPTEIAVSKDSFPANWDNYHYKAMLLGERFLAGEENIVF